MLKASLVVIADMVTGRKKKKECTGRCVVNVSVDAAIRKVSFRQAHGDRRFVRVFRTTTRGEINEMFESHVFPSFL